MVLESFCYLEARSFLDENSKNPWFCPICFKKMGMNIVFPWVFTAGTGQFLRSKTCHGLGHRCGWQRHASYRRAGTGKGEAEETDKQGFNKCLMRFSFGFQGFLMRFSFGFLGFLMRFSFGFRGFLIRFSFGFLGFHLFNRFLMVGLIYFFALKNWLVWCFHLLFEANPLWERLPQLTNIFGKALKPPTRKTKHVSYIEVIFKVIFKPYTTKGIFNP